MTVYEYHDGIIIPIKIDPSREPTMREKISEQYYKLHKLCPECGGIDYWVTTMGVLFTNIETAIDYNQVGCSCGWRGIVHDLLPDKSQ